MASAVNETVGYGVESGLVQSLLDPLDTVFKEYEEQQHTTKHVNVAEEYGGRDLGTRATWVGLLLSFANTLL